MREVRARTRLASYAVAALVVAVLELMPATARSDEGGVSFWLPGLYGSLAATPVGPGWFYESFYYHWTGNAGAEVVRAREFQIGRLNPTLTVDASARLHAGIDI